MKSRKIILVIFLVIASVIGLATLQESVTEESQPIEVAEVSSETSSELKTINVQIGDGVGSGDT